MSRKKRLNAKRLQRRMFCDKPQCFSFRETFANREPAIVIGEAVAQKHFRPRGIDCIREAASHQIAHDALFATGSNNVRETSPDFRRVEVVEKVIRKDKVPPSRRCVGQSRCIAMQRHDLRILGKASLRELHDTDIVVHAGDGEADAFAPTTIDQPHGQITAPRTDIEHRPGALGIAAHPLEDVAAQQTVAGRQVAIDPLKLLQRVSQ